MSQKFILINQLSPVMEANKDAIVELEKYFQKKIPVPDYLFKMLLQMEFMIIDEDETDIYQHFNYPVQISVYSSDKEHLFCMLEDVSCFE